MTPILLDTGVIVALMDSSEGRHKECVSLLASLERPLVTCEAVIAESCYLLRKLSGASEIILENVEKGVFHIPFQLAQSAGRVRVTLRKYNNIVADFADACLIDLADMVGTGDILTLDSDFYSYRWRRIRAFNLLISP